MSSKSFIFGFCILCVLALGVTASASVTDPNIIVSAAAIDGSASGTGALTVVNGGLLPGATPYADRDYVFGVDANNLEGLDYVQTYVSDKTDDSFEYTVTLDGAGTVYLIIDNRVGDEDDSDAPTLGSGIMDWVATEGFTQTAYSCDLGGTLGTVYAKTLAAAGTVSTYEQNDGGSRVNYLLAAAPAGWNLRPLIADIDTWYQVIPGGTLTFDGTINDDGVPGTGISVEWTTVSTPAGATVTYTDDESEDTDITFSDGGEYTLLISVDDGEKTNSQMVTVVAQLPTFAVEATNWVEACNDTDKGPTTHLKSTKYMYMRNNSAPRRRIQLISYDISGSKEAGKAFANSYLTMRGHKCSGGSGLWVYGVKEEYDNFDLNTGNWSNLPGVANTPVPDMADPITINSLDLDDLSDLLAYRSSVPNGSWTNSDPSAALDEFLNSDDDGTVLLLFVTLSPESSDLDIYAKGYGDAEPVTGMSGIFIQGNILDATWATNPNPVINSEVSYHLPQLSWSNPAAVGSITADVYIGTGDPNYAAADYGYDTVITGTSAESASLSGITLTAGNTYNWIVDVTDSGTGIKTQGFVWNFTAIDNLPPSIEIAESYQYLWLGNDGDPAACGIDIDATVTDDGVPVVATLLWEQIDGPEVVTIDPNNVEDLSFTVATTGTYTFRLTADDTENSTFSATEIYVGTSPCDAAQNKPGYESNAADFNNDCLVDLADFATFADNWLVCNPSMDAACE